MPKKSPRAETGIEAAPRRHKDIIDRQLVRDTRLSLRALGIAVRLLSNVPGYTMTSLDLARERKKGAGKKGEGRDAVRNALSELETIGYLQRHTERLQNGQCVTRMVITDALPPPTPENQASVPTPENPMPGLPAVGGLGFKSSKSSSSKNSNKENTITTTAEVVGVAELVWPRQLGQEQVVVILEKFEEQTLEHRWRQAVLDEFAGLHLIGKAPNRPMSWLPAMIKRAAQGEFVPDAGLQVANDRARRAKEAEERAAGREAAARATERTQDPQERLKRQAKMVEIAAAVSRS